MSRVKELNQILDDMVEAGNKMIEAANALKEYFSSPAEPKPEKPKEEPAPARKEETKPSLTKEDVRMLLSAKSTEDEGKYKPQVKALVQKYSKDRKLSGVNPEQYGALTKELEAIGNG